MRKVVGWNFLKLREEKGLTQEEFAAKHGFTQQYLSGLENGQRNPTVITLYELARVLGVDCAALLKPISEVKKKSGRGRPRSKKSK